MTKENIVITHAHRTAVGSLSKSLKNINAFQLGANVISEILKKSKINKDEIDEVVLGQVLTGGTGQNPADDGVLPPRCGEGSPVSAPSAVRDPQAPVPRRIRPPA